MKLARVQGEPAKPSKARSSPKSRPYQRKGPRHILQPVRHRGFVEPVDVCRRVEHELHFDPALVPEPVGLAHPLRHDQDVAKQDRRVKAKPPNRLQGDLGSQLRRSHQFEEAVLLLERAVFRQGAARLPHQPNRRIIQRPAAAGVQEPLPPVQRRRLDGRARPSRAPSSRRNGRLGRFESFAHHRWLVALSRPAQHSSTPRQVNDYARRLPARRCRGR